MSRVFVFRTLAARRFSGGRRIRDSKITVQTDYKPGELAQKVAAVGAPVKVDRKARIPMLMVLYGSAFIAAFNENIVNVALVKIMEDFACDAGTAQWLVTGYMLVTAVIVPVMAFLSRRFTMRQVFFEGCLFLGVGSALGILAPNFGTLLAARLIQSVGTGIFIPLMMTAVLAVVPARRVGTFISIGGCCITLGPALAPALAGVFVTLFGWRSVFFMPGIGICVLFLCGLFFVKNTAEPMKIRLDALSVILSALGLSIVVYGLSKLAGTPVPAVAMILAGALLLVIFARRQGKLATPMLDLSPLRNPRFSIACVLAVVAMMTTFSMSVLLPLYYGTALEQTALAAGLLLLVPIIVNAVTSILGGRVMDKRGEFPLLPLGFLFISIGQIATAVFGHFALLVSVFLGSILVYAGVGSIFSPSQAAGLRSLPHEQSPHGVAILSTFIQVSACIGPALFIGILSATIDAAGPAIASGETTLRLAQAEGFSAAVTLSAFIAVAGTITAYFYARRR